MLAEQAGQLAYLGGGDLLELRREPSLSPLTGGGAIPAAGGQAAQIASLTEPRTLTIQSCTRRRWALIPWLVRRR